MGGHHRYHQRWLGVLEPLGTNRTGVRLVLEYDPEGVLEKVGDWLNVVSRQAQNDLEKFKEFIESSGSETGAWPGW